MTKPETLEARSIGQDELDKKRREFADRVDELIKREPTMQDFSAKSGIPMRYLSQWRSRRHLNWPNVASLMRIAITAGVSIDWLVFGRDGEEKQKHVRRVQAMR